MTTEIGTIEQWNEEKAFGFIRSASGGERVFFHINDVNRRAGRPRIGVSTEYRLSSDDAGRRCAVAVSCKASRFGGDLWRHGRPFPKLVAVALMGWVTVSSVLGFVPLYLAPWYAIASLVAVASYWADKKAALVGHRRVPENALHLWTLIGGGAGALVSQTMLRHKTKKLSFRVVFYTTLVMNVVVFGWLHTRDGAFFIQKVTSILQSLIDLV